jgi:hypothetical protein
VNNNKTVQKRLSRLMQQLIIINSVIDSEAAATIDFK